MGRTRNRAPEAEERRVHHLKLFGHHGHVLGDDSIGDISRSRGGTHCSHQLLIKMRKARQGADTGNQGAQRVICQPCSQRTGPRDSRFQDVCGKGRRNKLVRHLQRRHDRDAMRTAGRGDPSHMGGARRFTSASSSSPPIPVKWIPDRITSTGGWSRTAKASSALATNDSSHSPDRGGPTSFSVTKAPTDLPSRTAPVFPCRLADYRLPQTPSYLLGTNNIRLEGTPH